MHMWETYWPYGESSYSCPETLRKAMSGSDHKFPYPLSYVELPDTGIGADTISPADWRYLIPTPPGNAVGVTL